MNLLLTTELFNRIEHEQINGIKTMYVSDGCLWIEREDAEGIYHVTSIPEEIILKMELYV